MKIYAYKRTNKDINQTKYFTDLNNAIEYAIQDVTGFYSIYHPEINLKYSSFLSHEETGIITLLFNKENEKSPYICTDIRQYETVD